MEDKYVFATFRSFDGVTIEMKLYGKTAEEIDSAIRSITQRRIDEARQELAQNMQKDIEDLLSEWRGF